MPGMTGKYPLLPSVFHQLTHLRNSTSTLSHLLWCDSVFTTRTYTQPLIDLTHRSAGGKI